MPPRQQSTAPTKDLTVAELAAQVKQRVTRLHEAYAVVLGSVHRRIENAARIGATTCVFDAPSMIVGHPAYDLVDCLDHVAARLQHSGFNVRQVPPSFLVVDWTDAMRKAEGTVSKAVKGRRAPRSRA